MIDIKPSHKGRFTAWAKAHGFKSVQEAASSVLANKANHPAAVVKMANFAHSAESWKQSAPTASKLTGM